MRISETVTTKKVWGCSVSKFSHLVQYEYTENSEENISVDYWGLKGSRRARVEILLTFGGDI